MDKVALARKLKFIKEYAQSPNAATGSKYDSNSNVVQKNIATLSCELEKKDMIHINRGLMLDSIKELYGEELAAQYIKDLDNHIIYRHDETSIKPYCCSISMYPFILDGSKTLGDNAKNPEHDDTFIGAFVNFLYMVASQFAGAVAIPEFLTYFDHMIRKEYGQNYPQHLDDEYPILGKTWTLRKTLEGLFEQFVYSINSLSGARNFQSPFTNIAYFDKFYFANVFKDFIFPDGDEPCWETTKELQKLFMKWFNKERTKAMLTFPVETANLLVVDGKYADEETADFMAEMWAEGHSFFMYQSDSVDSLSSCCFDGSQKVLIRSSKTGPMIVSFNELDKYTTNDIHNLCVFHNGAWVKAKRVKLPKRPLFKVTTVNNKELIVTDNHINPTLRGDIVTSDLTTEDYILFNTQASDSTRNKDREKDLTYEQGYLIGLYAGDGSIYKHTNCDSLEVTWSLNREKNYKSTPILQRAINQLGINYTLTEYDGQNHVYFVKACQKDVAAFIRQFIIGESSETKAFNLGLLDESKEFRQGIIDGYYDSDGGNSNRIYSTSKAMIDGLEAIFTSLGQATIIDVSDRVGEYREIRGEPINVTQPLYCIRWYHNNNKRKVKDIYITKNNSIYFKIKSIEPYESESQYCYCLECLDKDEPYFTLPNGIITHNCRLRNGIEDNVFSYTLGAGGVQTGSKCVITLNLNRIVQNWKKGKDILENETLPQYVERITNRVHSYLTAWNHVLKQFYDYGFLPVYTAGYIALDKQFLTVGVNGFLEAAEFLGIQTSPDSEEYRQLSKDILGTIERLNREHRTEHTKFNLEFVPAENLAYKNYEWDKKDGYWVPTCRNMYNSYFYPVEDTTIDPVKKFYYQGKGFADICSGGVALHNNLNEHLSKIQYRYLMDVAVKAGCNYFTFNVPNSICNQCGHIDKRMLEECPECHSHDLDYAVRVIGFLKRISNFSEARQKEAAKRSYKTLNNNGFKTTK